MFYSQSGQDQWVLSKVDKGFFVDVGAYDGIQTSNTYALQGWDGVCIEADYMAYDRLIKNRNCVCINRAVTDYNGYCRFSGDRISDTGYTVGCGTLTDILDTRGVQKNIDYLSLDIEGNELKALQGMDFDKYNVKLITVETNLYLDGPERKDKIFELLTSKGFTRVQEDVLCLDTNPAYYLKPYEDWYEK